MILFLTLPTVPDLDKIIWPWSWAPSMSRLAKAKSRFEPKGQVSDEKEKGGSKDAGWMQSAACAQSDNEVELVPQPWWFCKQLMSYTDTDPAEWCLEDTVSLSLSLCFYLSLCLSHTHTHSYILTLTSSMLESPLSFTFTNGPASEEGGKAKICGWFAAAKRSGLLASSE